jgi:hypothetical protein
VDPHVKLLRQQVREFVADRDDVNIQEVIEGLKITWDTRDLRREISLALQCLGYEQRVARKNGEVSKRYFKGGWANRFQNVK